MYKYTVLKNQPLTSTSNLLTLKISDTSQPFNFLPGQYASISFYKGLRPTTNRSFSITNSPTDPGILQFATRTSGKYTAALTNLKIGDKVNVIGPFGKFVINVSAKNELYFFAGGIGITPFISMLRYIDKLGLDNKITLFFSVKNTQDIPFYKELNQLEQNNRYLNIVYIVGNPDTSFRSKKVLFGRINQDIIKKIVNGSQIGAKYYVCGPAGYMRSVREMLNDEQVGDDNIYSESFSQKSDSRGQIIASWPFNIYIVAAITIVLGSLLIMAADLIKSWPSIKASNSNNSNASNNSRQNTVNSSINSLQNQNTNSSSTSGTTNSSASNSSSGSATSPTTNSVQTTTPTTSSSVVR